MESRMRTCSKCKETKDVTLFNKDNSKASGYRSHCKQCDAEKQRGRKSGHRLLGKKFGYNITVLEYNDLFTQQNGLCAICNKPDRRRLAVDHDHITGKTRGLLCTKCNLALGLIHDDTEILLSMLIYLQQG